MKRQITVKVGTVVTLWMQIWEAISCFAIQTFFWQDLEQNYDYGFRVAKCHGYDGYIRVKIFRGWGKKSERTHNVTKLGLF